MAGTRWRGTRHCARILQGEGPGKTERHCTTTSVIVNQKADAFRFCEQKLRVTSRQRH